MFWRFGGYANISSIDSILDKPDCTLEEILDENDIEQELKAQNAKLIDFLRDEVVLGKLLRYVIAPRPPRPVPGVASPPTEDEKEKSGGFFKSRSKVRSKSRSGTEEEFEAREERWRRYSFVSTQLLSSEVWSIAEFLLECTDILREFWAYVKMEPEIDNMQASNFTKVNETLLDKKPVEMCAFFKTIDGLVDNMIKHVNCPVIMDLLLKMISLEKEQAPGIVDWLQTQDLIPKLMTFISPDNSATVQTAAGDFLKAIITISANATGQDTSVIGPNELTRQLVSETCIDQLMAEMLEGGNPLTVGVGIVIEVIRKNNSDYDQDTQIGPEPKSSDPIYLGTLLRIFANHINDFMDLILSPKHTVMTDGGSTQITRKGLPTAWGAKIEPLGFDRFKTCELMAELLHCSNMGLLNESGAEAEVRRRDAERDRLKAEGKLAAERPTEETADFGVSVDSHGFHHAEAFSPLGASPENVRSPGPQDTGLEEDFEKVNLSEADPDVSSETTAGSVTSAPPSGPAPTKRRSSLLTEQLQKEKEKALSPPTSPSAETDRPPPLFAKQSGDSRATDATPAEGASSTEDSTRASEVTSPETKPADNADDNGEDFGVQRDGDGTAVVGDLLKMKFVEHHVVPNIIDFFFRFPWNNFLHNVVYDVVQQVFNGAMDRGYNRTLAIDLFETGRVTERVIEGQKRSDEAQKDEKMRLGYMGHLTLVAEEVVKFTERQPAETLAQSVVDKVSDAEWAAFVENTLTETRERDNAILGGVRPDNALGPRQAVLNAVNAAQNSGLASNNAIANVGLAGNGGLDSLDLASAGAAGYGLGSSNANQLLSGFNNSDDEEDEEPEEGELSANDGAGSRHRIDDEDQATELEDPEKPAPLSLPPIDKAKKAFFNSRRKAHKKTPSGAPSFSEAVSSPDEGLVTTPTSSDFEESGKPVAGQGKDPSSSAIGALAAGAGLIATASAGGSTGATDADFPEVEESDGAAIASGGGFDDDFTGFGSDEGQARSSDDEADRDLGETASDGEDEDDDNVGLVKPLRRQTTRESLERRPIDEGSNSSEEEDESNESEIKPTASPSSIEQSQQFHREAIAEAKKKEQGRLLKQWGLDAGDDSDEDDEPVSMGSKYLSRRRPGS